MVETTRSNVNDEDLKILREDVRNLRGELKGLVDAAKNAGIIGEDNTMAKIKKALSNLDEKAKDKLEDAYSNVSEQGERVYKAGVSQVEERPLAIVLASFLAGIVIGKLILK
ncbi:MAG: hypothetical protein GF315_07745 [candidate division Zixibacteria bacterium]|nr:hypothetical protein [candidate division Zixibacteria bacterium]